MDEEFLKKFVGESVSLWMAGCPEEFGGKLIAVDNGVAVLEWNDTHRNYLDAEMVIGVYAVI